MVRRFLEPRFFHAAKGWQPIDSTLSLSHGRWTSGSNSWTASFGAPTDPTGVERIDTPSGVGVGFNPVGVSGGEHAPVVSGSTATYADLWQDTTVTDVVSSTGVKETLSLASASAPSDFAFDVSGASLSSDGHGGLLLHAGHTVVGWIPAPTVATADGSSVSDAAASYSVIGSKLHVSVSRAWLTSLPVAAFPVAIDPTYHALFSPSTVVSYQSDNGASSTVFKLGTSGATTYDAAVNVPLPAPPAAQNSQPWRLSRAELGLSCPTACNYSGIHAFAESGKPLSYGAVSTGSFVPATFSTVGGVYTTYVDLGNSAYATGNYPWVGFTAPSSAMQQIPTADITFEYNYVELPPPAAVTSPSDGSVIATTTPTLTTTVTDAQICPSISSTSGCDMPYNVLYDFKITSAGSGNAGQTVADSGWFEGPYTQDPSTGAFTMTNPTWTVPAGSLVDGAKYTATVQVTNAETVYPNDATQGWVYNAPPTGPPSTFQVKMRLDAGGPSPTDTVGSPPSGTTEPAKGGPNPGTPPSSETVNMVTGDLAVTVGTPSMQTVAGSAGVSLSYNSSQSSTAVAAASGGTGYGLTGRYFRDSGSHAIPMSGAVAVKVEPTVNVAGGFGSAPVGGLPVDTGATGNGWIGRWTGVLTLPPTDPKNFPSGTTFSVGGASTGGLRVLLNGTTAYDNWAGTTVASGTPGFSSTQLNPGSSYQIEVDNWDANTAARTLAQLWIYANIPSASYQTHSEFVVPATWLTTVATGLPPGWTLNLPAATWTSATDLGNQVVLHAVNGATATFTALGHGQYQPQAGDSDSLIAANGQLQLSAVNGYVYVFNADGTVASVTSIADDRKPAALQYGYAPVTAAAGSPVVLQTITDPVSQRGVNLYYGGQSNCPSGNSAPANMLCHISFWDGTATDFWYNSNQQLAGVVNPGSSLTLFGYNSSSQVNDIRDALANDYIWVGLPGASSCTVGSPSSGCPFDTLVGYDSAGRVASVTQPAPTNGAARPQRSYTYLPSTTVPGAGTTLMAIAGFSPAGNANIPAGYASAVTYDSQSRIVAQTDATGLSSYVVFDNLDRPIITVDKTGEQTSIVYDVNNNPTDSYGPAPEACFTAGTSNPWPSNTSYTNPPAPIQGYLPVANPSATSGCQTSVPHTHNGFDENLTGLGVVYFPNGSYAGAATLHGTGVGIGNTAGATCNTGRGTSNTALCASWPSGSAPGGTDSNGNWSMKLTGNLTVANTATYTFTGTDSQPLTLIVDGNQVGTNQTYTATGAPSTVNGSFTAAAALTAGKHTVELDLVGSKNSATSYTLAADVLSGHVTFVGAAQNGQNPGLLASNVPTVVSYPSGVAAGDVALMAVTLPKGTTVTTPTGWSVLGTYSNGNLVGSNATVEVLDHTLTGGESSVSVAFSAATANTVDLAVYRGADLDTPVDATSNTVTNAGTSLPLPAVTTTLGNDVLVALAGQDGQSSATWTPPTGMTSRSTLAEGAVSAVFADSTQATPGSSGTQTATLSASSALAGMLVALKPAVTATTPFALSSSSPGYGLKTSSTDPDGKTTATTYTAAGLGAQYQLPVSQTVGAGTPTALTTTTGYETPGTGYLRKTSRTLPAGNSSSYGYWGDTETLASAICGVPAGTIEGGQLKSQTDPAPGGSSAARAQYYVYDAAGRRVGRWVGAATTSFANVPVTAWQCSSFDARGRTMSQTWPAVGTAPARTVTYTYAVNSNPLTTSVSDTAAGNKSITTTVDLLGRLITYTESYSNQASYQYDQAGRLVTRWSLAGQVSNRYDPNTGNLASVLVGPGTVATASYDAGTNRLTAVTYANGTKATLGYDRNGRKTSLVYTRVSDGSLVTGDQVTNSDAGRITSELENLNGTLTNPNPAGASSATYNYDGAGRLTKAYLPGSVATYGYGANPSWDGCATNGTGANTNRTNVTVTPNSGTTPTTTDYCYNGADQLTSSLGLNSRISLVGAAQNGQNPGLLAPNTPTVVTYPAGTQTGDLALAAVTVPQGTTATTVTTPTGWTVLGTYSTSNTIGNNVTVEVLDHAIGSGETSVSVAFSQTTVNTVNLAVYRGADAATPIDASSNATANSSKTLTLPSVTSSLPNDVLVAVAGQDGQSNANGIWTAPPGMTSESSLAEGAVSAILADRAQPAQGSSGSQTATLPGAAAVAGMLLALKPATTSTSASYDSHGNQAQDGGTTLSYDAADRLASTTVNGATTTYGYDALDRVLTRTSGGATTYYIYGGFDDAPVGTRTGTGLIQQIVTLPGGVTYTIQNAGAYTPITATRILDTRNGTGAPQAPLGANGGLAVQVAGVAGVPSDVSAVAVNLAVTGSTATGSVQAYTDYWGMGSTANIDYNTGQTISNAAIIPVSSDGKIRLYNTSTGTVQAILDVQGYFEAGSAINAGTYVPLPSARILDTRNGTGAPQAPVAAGGTIQLQVGGQAYVPTSNVTAVVLNVTATGSATSGGITAYPDGTTQPDTTNLYYTSGQTLAGQVIVPMSSSGIVDLTNTGTGSTQLLADVAGYYSNLTGDINGGSYQPVTSARILDTATGVGTTAGPVAAGGTVSVQVTGQGGVPSSCVTAVVLTLTASGETSAGGFVAYPDGDTRPTAAFLNYAAGQTLANMSIVPIKANGKIDIYNSSNGTTQISADISGYFQCAPAGSASDVWSYPDLHGNTSVTTNNQAVQLGPIAHYDPWGAILTSPTDPTNSAATASYTSFGAASKVTDQASGITIMGARAYNAIEARFTSVDPIEGGCANNYVYVFGDPLQVSDLSGQKGCGKSKSFWGTVLGDVSTVTGALSIIPTPFSGLLAGVSIVTGVGAAAMDCPGQWSTAQCVMDIGGAGLGAIGGAGKLARGFLESEAARSLAESVDNGFGGLSMGLAIPGAATATNDLVEKGCGG